MIKTGSDSLALYIGEDPTLTATHEGTDAIPVLFDEDLLLNVTLATSTDDLIIAIADTVADLAKIDKLIIGQDSIPLLYAAESSDLAVTLASDDSLAFYNFESNPYRVYHDGTDKIPILLGDETSYLEEWYGEIVRDSLALRWGTETGIVSATPTIGTDTLCMYFDVDPLVLDFWRACNLPKRRIYGKAEIAFVDPFVADGGVTITAPDCSYPSTEASLVDGRASVPGKWMIFKDNLLDGTSLLCPRVDDYKADYTTGWWSDTLSDESGVFSPAIEIILEFPARPVYEVKMIGDPYLGGLPRDFTINIYAGETLATPEIAVTANENYNWTQAFTTALQNVTKIAYSISKIAEPLEQCRILELFSSYKEDYDEDEIKEIRILEELDYESGTIPIGNISSNEIVLKLHNENRRFDASNSASPIRNLMLKHRRIKTWLGVYLSITTGIVWQPMGTFYSMDWSAPDDSNFVEILGYDRLEVTRTVDFTPQGVYNNYTIGDILEEVFTQAGVLPSEYEIDALLYDDAYKIPYAWFDRMSCRDAIQRLAENSMSFVYCDRNGKVVVKAYDPGETAVVEFNSDNYYKRDNPLRWSEMVNYLEVVAKPRAPSAMPVVVYSDTDTFGVSGNGGTVERTYYFDKTPVYGEITVTITADFEGLTYTADPYPWGIKMKYTNPEAGPIVVSAVTCEGHILEETGGYVIERSNQDSINKNGKVALDEPIELEFIQSEDAAKRLAYNLIQMYSDPQRDVVLNARGYLGTMLGDRVSVKNVNDDNVEDYNIVRQEIEWSGPLRINITGRKVNEDILHIGEIPEES